MRKINSLLFGFLSLSIVFLTGCNAVNERTSVYIPEPSLGTPLIDSLYIEKIANEQPQEEMLPFNPNNDPWILIPLCFYSTQKVDPIVKQNFFQNDLDVALHRLFIKDLRASNISKEICSCYCESTDNSITKTWENKHRLQLVLKHAVWNRHLTAYGLSYPGTFLWTLGFPTSYGNVQLEVDAILFPPGRSQKPLGKTTLKREISCVELLYDQIDYQPSVSEAKLAEMFPLMAKDLRKFLSKTLKKK